MIVAVGYIERDMTPCVVYRADGDLSIAWVRPVTEFMDGRFTHVEEGPDPSGKDHTMIVEIILSSSMAGTADKREAIEREKLLPIEAAGARWSKDYLGRDCLTYETHRSKRDIHDAWGSFVPENWHDIHNICFQGPA